MSRRRWFGAWFFSVLVFAGQAALADEPPKLVKIRLKGGRTIVGEVIEQSREAVKLRDLRSGKEGEYAADELLKVERNVADSEAIASAGLPAFIAWKLSRSRAHAAGKVAEVKPTAIYVTIGTKSGIHKGQKLFVYRDEGEIKDPDTGEVLERQRAKIAELLVTEAREKISKAKLLGDLEVQLRVGDQVETDEGGKAIAVMPPVDETGHRTVGGEKLAEDLSTALASHGIRVAERTLLKQVLDELTLQTLIDENKVRKLGKQVGAYAVMTGRLVQSGRFLNVHVRLIEVETGEVLLAASQKTTGEAGEALEDSDAPSADAEPDSDDLNEPFVNPNFKKPDSPKVKPKLTAGNDPFLQFEHFTVGSDGRIFDFNLSKAKQMGDDEFREFIKYKLNDNRDQEAIRQLIIDRATSRSRKKLAQLEAKEGKLHNDLAKDVLFPRKSRRK